MNEFNCFLPLRSHSIFRFLHIATNSSFKAHSKQATQISWVSNYFKHVYEWPKQWATPAKGFHKETIDIVLRLGMKPGEMTDNLLLAANGLGLCHSNPQALAWSIEEWRAGWARVLYPAFGLQDPRDPMAR